MLTAKQIFKPLLDFILPPRCVMCRSLISSQVPGVNPSGICGSCWPDLTFLSDASCVSCAYPFEVMSDHDQYCGDCLTKEPPFSHAHATLLYDGVSRDLILKFKHGDHTHLSPIFARWMLESCQRSRRNLLQTTDLLIPVPLHWTRLVKRQFNQASLLANDLGRLTGLTVDHGALLRSRATASQGHLSFAEREENVKGNFFSPHKKNKLLNKKVITLVDDVYTSGATVRTCAEELRKAGVKDVYVLTLARVARL